MPVGSTGGSDRIEGTSSGGLAGGSGRLVTAAITRVAKYLRSDPRRILLLCFYLTFVAGWSAIALWRFYSFNSYIFDLGVAMEEGWLIYHTHWTLLLVLNQLFTEGILFIVFPITIPQSYPLLLVFQAAEVGGAAFPLYGIARRSGLGPNESLMVAGAFLGYFPLSGVLWFDFHYQTLFMVLFLSGYYFYLRRNPRTAAVLIALSGMAQFPYAIFSLLFALWWLVESFAPRPLGHARTRSRQPLLAAVLLVVSTVLLVGGIVSSLSTLSFATGLRITTAIPVTAQLNAKFLTVFFFLGPVLFVPLFSPKWMTFLFLPGYLIFFSGAPAYLEPAIQFGPLASGIAPFVFLGLIEGAPRASRFFDYMFVRPRATHPRTHRRPLDPFEVVSVSAAVIILTALILTPYGPFNQYTGKYDMQLYDSPGPNMTRFNEVESVIGLIPASTPYVIAQEGLPELYPRPLAQATYPVLNPVLSKTFPANLTENQIANNTIPINVWGKWQTTRADYAVGDPYLYTLWAGHPTMMRFMQLMYDSGHFGVVAEESGITLLARDYSGPVKAFVPWYDSLLGSNTSSRHGPPISGNSSPPGPPSPNVWTSQSDFFVPGTYHVSARVWVGSTSCSASASLGLLHTVNGSVTNLTTVSACDLLPDQWNWISGTTSIDAMWEGLVVEVSFSSWPRAQMSDAVLMEIGPPTNTGVI